jgi:Family of unknown function (DUF5677)
VEDYTTIQQLDKLINKFIKRSKDFINYAAFPYGTFEFQQYKVKSSKFTYDHDYFAFVKSTKSLVSIRALLKLKHNEDVLILVRSIFENYLSSRFLNENEDKIDDLVINPINIFYANYIVLDEGKIVNREKEVVGQQLNPATFKIGKDKGYYYNFYGYLSSFSHSNFGIAEYFLNQHILFTVEKDNDPCLTRFFTVFVFTKIFEHVVTVEGEDFINPETEKICYDLVKESLLYQDSLIPSLIDSYQLEDEHTKHMHKRMRKMLKDMKKSLREELGSVDKSFLASK